MAKPSSPNPAAELPIPVNGTVAAGEFASSMNGQPHNVSFDESRAWLRGVAAIQNADDLAAGIYASNLLAGSSTLWANTALNGHQLSQIGIAQMLPQDPSWKALDARVRPLFLAWQAERDEAELARQQAAQAHANATAAIAARRLQLESDIAADAELAELLAIRDSIV